MSDYTSILLHIPPALLVVFRIGGLMIYGPVFGSAVIPVRVKVMLALLVGMAVYPVLLASGLTGAGAGVELRLASIGPLVAVELLLGLVVGYIGSIPLVAVQTGGLLVGQQMGLGFARFYNPGIDDEADVLGQLLFFMALAGFLIVGGHEALVLAVLRSFEYVPLGAFAVDLDLLDLLLGLLLAAFDVALRIAAPVLAIIFLQSLAMGFMAKTVPQLNILSLGFVVRILVGLSIIMFGLVIIDEVVMETIAMALDELFLWIQSLRS